MSKTLGIATLFQFFFSTFNHEVSVGPSNTFSDTATTLPARTVYQFASDVWIENLAVRANGQVLVTSYTPSASLYVVDPSINTSYPTALVHNFESSSSALGIVETTFTEPDIFYVATLDYSVTEGFVPYTGHIWQVNMTTFEYSPHTGHVNSPASVSHVVALPDAAIVNGITLLGPDSSHILVSDSWRGVIWDVDTAAGTYAMSSSYPAMRSDNEARKKLGIDTIQVSNNYLYFNNAGDFTLYRMPIHKDGTAIAEPTLVAESLLSDGFCMYGDKSALITMNIANGLATLDLTSGERWILAGGTPDSVIRTPTAVELGRGKEAGRAVFLTTGGVPGKVGGSLVVVEF